MEKLTYSQPPKEAENQQITIQLDGNSIGTISLFYPTKLHQLMNQFISGQWAHLQVETSDGNELRIIQANGYLPYKERHWTVLNGNQVIGKIKEELTPQAQVHSLTFFNSEQVIEAKKGHIKGSSKQGTLEEKGGEDGSVELVLQADSDYIRNGITTAHTVTLHHSSRDPLLLAAINYLLRLTEKE
ncbi:hypothetical protein [Alteribacter populi]|uniref:hypothetical protein n=1 Tax=Alteribacter populi TaxID=2011011 RepID=UPI000BBA5AAC|nr:hypothetical protein [Alteribacter populi]